VIQKYPQGSWPLENALQCKLTAQISLFTHMNALIRDLKKSLQENPIARLIFTAEITLGWMKL
jgi:hypothetical protein